MDATAVRTAIGEDAWQAIESSNLPKIETTTLLQIWESGDRAKLKRLAADGALLPLLKRRNRHGVRARQVRVHIHDEIGVGQALELANETRGQNAHLSVTECLQVAELPLTL